MVIVLLGTGLCLCGQVYALDGGQPASGIAIYENGSWYIDMNNDGVFGAGDRNAGFGAPLWLPVSGDWNGDTITEIGAYRDGAWYLDYDNSGDWSGGDRNYGFGELNWTPVAGDWDGNGFDEIGAYKDGSWYLDYNGNGIFDAGTDKNYAFGGAGWAPVVGIWTGDNKTKIGVYKDGIYYIDYNGDGVYGSGDKTISYGTTGSAAVTGDWNNNTLTEVGTQTGTAWKLDYDGLGAINASTKQYTFGAAGWDPVTGDWNNDGTDKIGIYLNGAWYLDYNGNGVWNAGTDRNYAFGTNGWTPVAGRWSTGPSPVANFTGTPRMGTVPLTVSFSDESAGSPDSWNWSFGDGNFSEEQSPAHTYEIAGEHNVTLITSKGSQSGNLTKEDYIYAEAVGATFNSEVILNSMPTTMFQGEHYLVDIKMNNTGTKKWFADPANPNLVNLKAIGGPYGDAAQFGITEIPMIFANESASPMDSYDFFFYVHAPDTIGTYTPQYQVNSSSGTFGEVASATVNVIENPFHPVMQANGSKLYTTPYGNNVANISVDIVGPRAYIDQVRAAKVDDPRFLINPALKSGVFAIELNETISYANITLPYDAANVTYTANLSLAYYNETTGNYTFVPTTLNTTGHTVTAQVSGLSKMFTVLDKNKYQALPARAQTEMGYIDIGPLDNSTVQFYDYAPVCTDFYFYSGLPLPPGNYTILATGQYNNILPLSLYPEWNNYAGTLSADTDYKTTSNTGMLVHFRGLPGAPSSVNVSKLRVSSGVLKVSHDGGPISMWNYASMSSYAGSTAKYKLYYGDGPVFRDESLNNITELNNTAFNKTDTGFDLAVTAYQAAAGCVLGQAGKKGGYLDSVHSAIPGWNDHINDDVTESTAYMVGQIACNVLFPEITLARDFTADVLRGDPVAVVLDSTGFLGPMRAYLGSSNIIPAFIAKVPLEVNAGNRIMSDLWRQGIYHTELPAIQKVAMLDKAFDGAATRLNGQGVTDDVIAAVYEKNGNIVKTLKAGARTDNGNVRWLEEGWTLQEAQDAGRNSATGWKHIVEDHIVDGEYTNPIKNQFAGAFDPTGTTYHDAESIQNLIIECAKNGKVNPSKPVEYYLKVTDTHAIEVIIGSNGYIRTAYPKELARVPIPLP